MNCVTSNRKSISKIILNNELKCTRTFAVVLAIAIIFLSGLFLHFEWNRYEGIAASEAVQLAQSLESIFQHQHIIALSGNDDDLEKPEYYLAKNSLIGLVEATNSIRNAYFLGQHDGEIVFLMDSKPTGSPDCATLGLVFENADNAYLEVFQTGNAMLTKVMNDRRGTWISAIAPVKGTTGSVDAVFAIDYSTSDWYSKLWQRMIPAIIITVCMLFISFSLLYGRRQNFKFKTLSQKTAYDEVLYRSVFEQAPVGIAIMADMSHAIRTELGDTSINPMYEKILGRSKSELQNLTWLDITHPEDIPADLEKFEQFKKGEINSYTMEKRFMKPDGSIVWVNMTISPFLCAPGEEVVHLCLLEDINMRKEAEAALKESERSKSVVFSHLPGMAYRCDNDAEWTMQVISDGCLELTGYVPESLLHNKDLSFSDLVIPEYRELLRAEWERVLADKEPFKYEYEITTVNGERKWVLEMGQGVYDKNGELEALEGIILDISDRKEIENNLRYITEHDGWTGLHNRIYLEQILDSDANKKWHEKRALVSVNMSTVQKLTATYGFYYMRELIKRIATSLEEHCTNKRLLFSTYENRFVFYIKEYKQKEELVEFCNSVVETLESILSIERIGGGIGVFEIDSDCTYDSNQLLSNILIASERAIELKDEDFGIYFYDLELEKQIIRELEINRELTQIASNASDGGLYLQYQPIVDLKTNQIFGFEALSRIKSDNLGTVSPLEFIPIAEKTKLIIPIGEKVFRQAFSFLKRLEESRYNNIAVSVNVSVIQLLSKDFCRNLLGIIDEMQVSPQSVGIEITESVFSLDYDEINHILGELKNVGIHIAIDDFGTGYSTLARERELNVNCLKIDKYFIDKLLDVEPERAITQDIISISHKFNHYSVAEGVEHETQRQYLLRSGCDKIQGYLISKPLDEDDAFEFLENYKP